MATAAERAKLAAAMKPQKRSKYGNKRTVLDGIKFDSSKEARRWSELKLLERAGEITDLERQKAFILRASSGEPVGKYICDFAYCPKSNGWLMVVEDVKSEATARDKLYVWKKKHLFAQYGITIKEV